MSNLVSEATKLHERSQELIFSFSTGALALSVTFRSSLVGNAPHSLWLLSIAWVLFTLSSLSYILGLMLEACIKMDLAKNPQQSLSRKHKLMIVIPNFLMTFAFIVGLGAFVGFALANNRV